MRWQSAIVTATLFAAAPLHAETIRPKPARVSFIDRREDAMQGLSDKERKALRAGETVTRPTAFVRGDGHYVGGVAFQIVRATPEDVMRAMTNPAELAEILPDTVEARQVGAHEIELVSGTSLVNARYTLKFRRVGNGELKFWLDPTRPHGIGDVSGFVRARPLGKRYSVLAVGVVLDLGSPIVRFLFEGEVQETALTTPRQVRDVFERRAHKHPN